MKGRLEVDLAIYKNIEEKIIDYPDYVIDWYFYLKANHQAATTCRDYINKIGVFLRYINDNILDVTPDMFTPRLVTQYFIKVQYKDDGTETSDSYKQGVWSCLNNFFDFLSSREIINGNVLIQAKIKRPKNNDLDRINQNRTMLTQEDFVKILEAVDNGAGSKKARGYQRQYRNRDKSIMLIFMTMGIRKMALDEINIDDIDMENRTLYIIDKGNKRLDYYINDITLEALQAWLVDRYYIMGNNTGALFISKEKKRMCGNSIAKLIDKYAYEALGYHISPHKLRSGFVSILYDLRHDAEFCRRAVGHSQISTTLRYIITKNDERENAAKDMCDLLCS